MSTINLPGFDSKPNSFIQWVEVNFKAVDWLYNFYNKESSEKVDTKEIEWIIIWVGFKFDTMVWKPSSKKSTKLVSDEFGYSFFQNWLIKIKKLVREWDKFEATTHGSKTYQDWKDEGQRLTKVVYVMDSKDTTKIFKLQFAWMAFGEITKLISKDAPNFVVTFWISEKPTETENGDFYLPTIIKGKAVPASMSDKIVEQIKYVDSILTKINLPSIDTGTTPSDAKKVFTEDIPY